MAEDKAQGPGQPGPVLRRRFKNFPDEVFLEFVRSPWGDGTVIDVSDREQRILEALRDLSPDWWQAYLMHWRQIESGWGPFVTLAIAVEAALAHFDRFQRTRKQREEKARRIAELAGNLSQEMRELGEHFPFDFIDAAYEFGDAYAEEERKALLALDVDLAGEAGESAVGSYVQGARSAAAALSLGALPSLLTQLEETARTWGQRDQLVGQPNLATARRNFFVVSMTRFMCEWCRKPLRKQTLELTGKLFDIEGMSESYLSKIAPVTRDTCNKPTPIR